MVSMISKPLPCIDHDANVAGTTPNKKNPSKVPKKIHKAEREKLKRDQLNELFSELGNALEPARQNSGKASILGDASRLLRDLIVQVASLRKENVALATESHYITAEKNELKDENTALEADIARLQNELRERLKSDLTWNNNGTTADPAFISNPTSIALPVTQPPITPLIILPLHQDLQAFPEPERTSSPPKPATQVRRPHARYPTPSDSWPLQILARHQHSGSISSNSSGDEGSEKA